LELSCHKFKLLTSTYSFKKTNFENKIKQVAFINNFKENLIIIWSILNSELFCKEKSIVMISSCIWCACGGFISWVKNRKKISNGKKCSANKVQAQKLTSYWEVCSLFAYFINKHDIQKVEVIEIYFLKKYTIVCISNNTITDP